LQRIIEATKEYQAAHPKQPRQRKVKADNKKNASSGEFVGGGEL